MSASIDLLANNATVGGGEVMMVALAMAARELGVDVRVVAPTEPDGTIRFARDHGLDVIAIRSTDRSSYLRALASKRRSLSGEWWWCNGLVPAMAVAGSLHPRVLHVHQEPTPMQRWTLAGVRLGARRIVVPSESMKDRVNGSCVLENWTEDLEFAGRAARVEPGALRVGFIGRFSPIKGLDVLARALQRLDGTLETPITLVLAGDGRFVSAHDTATITAELGRVRRVEQLGWVAREQFFDTVDLVVVPSVWAEPFGLVAAEAMASGLPVLVSDAGALPEVVGRDHRWIVRAGDDQDLADAIRRFAETDPETVARRVRAARERWEVAFSPTAGLRRVADLFESLAITVRWPGEVERT